LIAVAAEVSPAEVAVPREEIEQWIQSLPDKEKTKLLLNAALNGPNPQAELLTKFRESQNSGRQKGSARTVAQLLKAAEKRAEVRRRQERNTPSATASAASRRRGRHASAISTILQSGERKLGPRSNS
jgi:hypothetical protein